VNESEAYPTIKNPHAIRACGFSDADFSKLRRVIIDCEMMLGDAQLAALRECAARWYDLLEFGAFARPFGSPAETSSIRGKLVRFDQTSYEVQISRYLGSEIGFKVLGNMLNRFATRVHPIARVEFD
jgi:hypothetical protein